MTRALRAWRLRVADRPLAGALTILIIGLMCTVLAGSALRHSEQVNQHQLIDRRVATIVEAIRSETRRYEDTVAIMSAALGAQTELTEADFQQITAPVAELDLSGATGLSFVITVDDGDPTSDLAAIEASWSARGAKDLEFRPASGPHEHFFTVFKRVLDGTQGPQPGLDLAAAPEPAEAFRRARNHDTVAATQTYVLLRDRGLPAAQQQLSFLIVAPVHRNDSFVGWLMLGLRGRDFMSTVLAELDTAGFAVQLADVRSATTAIEVASVGDPTDVVEQPRTATIDVGGRAWAVTVSPRAGYDAALEHHADELALIAGNLISVLLAVLAWVVLRARAVALQQVARATAELTADIERRETVEQHLRSTQDALLLADQARSEFVSNISHELRTPLTSILGYIEMLTDGDAGALTPDQQRMLHVAQRNAQRLLALVEDLLSVASVQSGTVHVEHRTVSVNAVIAATIDALAPALDERAVHLDVQTDDALTVLGDPNLLERAITNVLSNAIKYSPPGETVTISATSTTARTSIIIHDRGIGIPTDEQDRLFEPFFRSSTAQSLAIQGTGLGLIIVRSIIEAHGGFMFIASDPHAGTSVAVHLPSPSRSDSSLRTATDQPEPVHSSAIQPDASLAGAHTVSSR